MPFFDDLANLCAREMSAARKSGDDYRKSAVIEGLATILGRTVAMAADGDASAIDTLLIGAENHAASEAYDFSSIVEFAASRSRK